MLGTVFRAAIAAADPMHCLAPHLPAPGPGRNIVIGAGKAAAAMAAAVEAAWPASQKIEGAVVTRYGHTTPTRKIKVLEAAHPVPDAASVAAANEMLGLVRGLKPEDQVIALISGGASSLLALPAPGLTLADKILVNRALLSIGAPIAAINRIRSKISAIKGGQLASACAPARLVTLAISDVPGDDPASIGSGPTWVPGADYRLIATPAMALLAAARATDIPARILGDAIEGDAAELGRRMASLALAERGPILLLSGGETTVTIGAQPAGRGGRNLEFLLSLALALDGQRGIYALAADSDGIDGTSDAAGALITPDTLARARQKNLDAAAMLARHDSFGFFQALGDLVITGPTLTNVNDIRAIFIP